MSAHSLEGSLVIRPALACLLQGLYDVYIVCTAQITLMTLITLITCLWLLQGLWYLYRLEVKLSKISLAESLATCFRLNSPF